VTNTIVITGASSGFGALAARALARAGHTVYASMRETTGRNAKQVREVEKYAADAGAPADKVRAAEYEAGPYAGFADQVRTGFASIVPPDADVSAVADAIVKVVDAPFGKRPFRVHIDPTQDGAEVVNAVSDRVRAELLRRIGLGDLLVPRDFASKSHGVE